MSDEAAVHEQTAARKMLRIARVTRTHDSRGNPIPHTREVQISIDEVDGRRAVFSAGPRAAVQWAEMILRFARECSETVERVDQAHVTPEQG